MRVFIFVGPTLRPDEVYRELPEATVMPPVRRGDVLRIVQESDAPSIIGIVDGYFHNVPAVTHKEVLFALSRGCPVFGASSMGALRAAELWRFGMRGVGEIFQLYRDNVWESDDEVAVSHELLETGYRPTSVSLANIRLALKRAKEIDLIGEETERRLTALARDRFYADRSWPGVLSDGRRVGLPERDLAAVKAYVDAERPDAKRSDALELLSEIRTCSASPGASASAAPGFDFEPTAFWDHLVSDSQSAGLSQGELVDSGISRSELQRHINLGGSRREVERGAALLYLLRTRRNETAARAAPKDDDFRLSLRRFRRQRGLLTSEDFEKWCRAEQVTDSELVLLIELESLLDSIVVENSAAVRDLIPLELKRTGMFSVTAGKAAAKKRLREGARGVSPSVEDVPLSFSELMVWYQRTFESVEGSLDEHAEARGFSSTRQFISELITEYQSIDAQ